MIKIENNAAMYLTIKELSLFNSEEEKLYYSLSGGHSCGDYANIVIDDEEEDGEIYFKYEIGNNEDKWKEWGSGRFIREKEQFIYDN